jgi:polysaccharide biosynthesis transport protein
MTAITLARSLATQARVVLVDLAFGAPGLAIIASDPAAPGLAELVQGAASFGEIITRDRYSRVHLVTVGREPPDAASIMGSRRLSIALEALARSYDHVVIDAGVVEDAALERLAMLAPRAVLVAPGLDDPATALARERLLKAGFANVSVLVGAPAGPDIGAAAAKAAWPIFEAAPERSRRHHVLDHLDPSEADGTRRSGRERNIRLLAVPARGEADCGRWDLRAMPFRVRAS